MKCKHVYLLFPYLLQFHEIQKNPELHYRNDLPIMHTLLHLKDEKCENSIIFARLK